MWTESEKMGRAGRWGSYTHQCMFLLVLWEVLVLLQTLHRRLGHKGLHRRHSKQGCCIATSGPSPRCASPKEKNPTISLQVGLVAKGECTP